MGIPHLISTLEPFAVRGPVEGEDAVIDGPALAYHVLHICRRHGIGQPAYDLLGRVALSWLNRLSNGVDIKAIYFDGYLPVEKLPVRMERMVKGSSQLNQFFSSCPGGCPERHLLQGEQAEIDLFTSRQPDNKQLLPPSFLVPAIINSLKQNPKYSLLVHVVPGEADAFCAKHLATHGGVVFTSDSDLLVHDLAGGKVVFFRDIYTADGKSNWECLHYDPRSICQRLGLPPEEARRLGYEVYRSSHSTIFQIARDSKLPVSNEKDFEDFCGQYLHHETSPVPATIDGELLHLERLDPRLSELALQLGNAGMDGEDARIFLPVLIENPMRGSAWEQNTGIRQLAYTIFRWLVPGQTSTVQEYRRVQTQKQKGRAVGLLAKSSAKTAIEELLSDTTQLKSLTQSIAVSRWLILCLIIDIRECQSKEKKPHILHMIEQSIETPNPTFISGNKVSWDLIHLTAQLQASYYSFRMLQQALSLVSDTCLKSVSPDAMRLQQELGEFPPLTDFPVAQQTAETLGAIPEIGILDILEKFVNIDRIPLTPPEKTTKTTKNKKRKKQREQTDTSSKRAATQSTSPGGNIFSLLGDE